MDSCGKPIVPERPATVRASIKFLANVEPKSFVALVLDSTTKRPLQAVSVDFPFLRLGAYSDSLGIVRFHDLPEGLQRLRVRRLGYEVRSDSIQIMKQSGAVAVYDLARRKVECIILTGSRT